MAEALYSREQIELWQTKLEAIAQKPRTTFTKKQAVEALIDTIEKALETRSFDEVATGMKEWGLDISAGSLKQYVSRYRRQLSTGAGSRKRAGQGKKVDEKGAERTAKGRPLGRSKQDIEKSVPRLPEPSTNLGLEDDPFEKLSL
jgi:hypothetical protein